MTQQVSIPRLRPVIRVFVSSTFSDMKHERNALAADAFPKLEQLCQRQGFQFQAIDLRWGVSTEAGMDHRTMRICFDELRRAQEISPRPNFLILLGNRYGWRPLPEEISVEEFHELEKAATTDHTADTDEHKSEARDQKSEVRSPSAIREIRGIRGQELDPLAVLNAWYRRDDNAVPPIYLLQSRRQDLGDGQDYTHDVVWNQVQAVLWTIINRAMPPEQLQRRFDGAAPDGSPPAIVRFQASATEQEIWHGALRVPDAREHVLAFFREIENLAAFSEPQPGRARPPGAPSIEDIKDFVDVGPSGGMDVALQAQQDRLKAELRQRLGSANVFRNESPARLVETQDHQGGRTADVTTEHLAQLCADLVSRLSEIIQGQIEEYWRKTSQASTDRAARELEIEQCEHERFAQERGGEESFVGRQVELQAMLAHVRSDSQWPLVIHGASGCGKTALLARAVEQLKKSTDNQPSTINHQPLLRFIGVAPRSSDLRSLLSSLCQELRQRNPRPEGLPTEIKELRDEFSQHLQAATPDQPLILFLDALDQLADADNGRLLNWLPPGSLPAHVKLVVSCLSDRATDDPAGQPYAELKRRQLPAENFINLDVLSAAEARLLFFDRWLPKAGRRVSDGQRARIEQRLASPACRQPIFLKLLFEEVQLWHSYDPVPVPGESVPALLGQLFNRLSQPTNHGPLLVNRVLDYLSASRHGLAENEILEILFADPEYRAKLNEATEQTRQELPPNAKRIPIALWSRLRFDLAPYLTERAAPGANVLTFYHRQMAEFVRGHLLDTPMKRQRRHERLAEYFHDQDYFLESLEEQRERARRWPLAPRPANVRKVDELPRQRIRAAELSGAWEEVEKLFTDLFFVEAKAEAGLAFALTTEFAHVASAIPANRPRAPILRLLSEALRRDIQFIARNPTTLFQCMWNTCWWYDSPDANCPIGGADTAWHSTADRDDQRLYRLMEEWRRKKNGGGCFLWIRSLTPPSMALDSAQLLVFAHRASVDAVRFFPNGKSLATAPAGGICSSVRIWDILSGEIITTLESDKSLNYLQRACLAISSDGRYVAGCAGCSVLLWTPRLSSAAITLDGHKDAVTCVSLAPDGQAVASASMDKTVRIWNVNAAKATTILKGHRDAVTSVVFSPCGTHLATCSRDKTVRLWDCSTGREVQRFLGHDSSIGCVAFSPDGSEVASASYDGSVRIWRLSTNREAARLDVHEKGALTVAFSPDGRWIASTSYDNAIRVWSRETYKEVRRILGHSSYVKSIEFARDSRRLASASDDYTARIWELGNDRNVQIASDPASRAVAACFSPDGKLLCSVHYCERGGRQTARLWSTHTGRMLSELSLALEEPGCGIACVAISSDKTLACGLYDGSLAIWDLVEGRFVRRFLVLKKKWFFARTTTVSALAFDARGTQLAIGASDGALTLYRRDNCQERMRVKRHRGGVININFFADDNFICTESEDRTVRLWESKTMACQAIIPFGGDFGSIREKLPRYKWSVVSVGGGWGLTHIISEQGIIAAHPDVYRSYYTSPMEPIWAVIEAIGHRLCLIKLEVG